MTFPWTTEAQRRQKKQDEKDAAMAMANFYRRATVAADDFFKLRPAAAAPTEGGKP